MITVDVIAKAFNLEGDFSDLVNLNEYEVSNAFKAIGYDGTEFKKKKEIKNTYRSK